MARTVLEAAALGQTGREEIPGVPERRWGCLGRGHQGRPPWGNTGRDIGIKQTEQGAERTIRLPPAKGTARGTLHCGRKSLGFAV